MRIDGDIATDALLGRPAAKAYTDPPLVVLLSHRVVFLGRLLPGIAQGSKPARNYRDCVHVVCSWRQGRDKGVAGFVNGHAFVF